MRNYRPKQVELIEIINKPLLLHLVGYLYYLQMGFNSVFKGLKHVKILLVDTMEGSCTIRLVRDASNSILSAILREALKHMSCIYQLISRSAFNRSLVLTRVNLCDVDRLASLFSGELVLSQGRSSSRTCSYEGK